MNAPTTRHDSALSRRAVLKTSAAMLAAPAFAGAAARPAPVLRIGLVGCGGRGTGAAVQALRADPHTRLVAMGDVFGDRLEQSLSAIKGEFESDAAARIDVPAERRFLGFDAYERVIDAGVDVVLLTSYPCFRPEHLHAAVRAGKHVFAEKPVAVDATGIRSCLESAAIAERNNTALLVGFCWRFHPGMREAFAKLHAGTIGDVVSAYTNYHAGTLAKHPRKPDWSDLEFQMRNWWHFTWISGDHIVEQSVHSVDRLAWAMRDVMPARVTCLGGRAARSGPEHGNVFDHFSAVYEYADGRRAFHSAAQIDGIPGDNKDYLFCSRGLGTIDSWGARFPFTALPAAGEKPAMIWDGKGDAADSAQMYQVEHNELFASIRAAETGGKAFNNGVAAAHSCLMAIMARMAAYTGKSVSWDQALNSPENLVPPSNALKFGPMPAPEVAVPGRTRLA
ncbi:MAG: Gfo/Idh/MocA family protein [Phycisphaerales bacterium]